MWISKKDKADLEQTKIQLERITEERDDWRAKYKCVTENQVLIDSRNSCVYISTKTLEEILDPFNKAKDRIESLEAEVTKLKKQYADEVQKRLALIEQMKG